MTVSFIGAQGNAGTTVTIPTHQSGDLILIFAYRDGNNAAPTTPSAGGTVPTWNSIGSSGGNTNSSSFSWARATAATTTSGTWTNATELVCLVYRGASVGASAGTSGNATTTINYPALTLNRTDGSSWVVGVAGHRTATDVEQAPGAMVNRASAGTEAAGHDTNGTVTTWASTNVTVNASSAYRSWVAELRDQSLVITADLGKFLLPERNIARYSEQFDNGYWGKTATGTGLTPVVTSNDAAAPDGTQTADRIVFDLNGGTTTNDRSDINTGTATPSVIGKTYIFSVWLKTTDGSSAAVQLSHNGAGTSIVTVTGTWQRFTSATRTAEDTSRRPRFGLRGAASTAAVASLHVWGLQWEEGTAITDYDPTGPVGATDAALLQQYKIDGDTGKLFLPERNLVRFSEEIDNSAWTKVRSSIAPNATISPDGLLRGDKVVEDTSNNTHILQLQNSVPAHIAGVTYTYSWHFKAGERTLLNVAFGADLGTFNDQAFDINLSTGVISNVSPSGFVSTPTATSVGSGWYRVSATVVANSSTLPVVRGRPVVGGTTSYLGDGVSGYFVWGAQVERGSTATDYDPTGPVGATDATLLQQYKINGDRGAFGLTGNAAVLSSSNGLQNYALTVDKGTFTLVGSNATLAHGSKLLVDAGAFALSGQAVTLLRDRRLATAAGVYVFTGNTVALLRARSLLTSAGSFLLTGRPGSTLRGYRLIPDKGTYTYTGHPVILNGQAPLVTTRYILIT